MKGIGRIVNSLSRLGGREIISRGSSKLSSSLLVSRRSLFISAAAHVPTNSPDLTSSKSSLLPQKWAFLGGMDLAICFRILTIINDLELLLLLLFYLVS